MHLMLALITLALLLCPATTSFGATVHRCQDEKGHITFTQLGCSAEHGLASEILNMPSTESANAGAAQPTKKVSKAASEKPPRANRQSSAVAGTGARQDGCGNVLTPAARRKAMINKEARPGMTQADVESMLGKPDSISSQNGKARFNYVDKHSGRKRNISFDVDGCVKS